MRFRPGTTASRRNGPPGLVRKEAYPPSLAPVTKSIGEKGADPGRWKERSVPFWRDDEGQGLVEYALIIVVIAIAVIVAMVFLKGQLQNQFSNIGNNLT